MNKTASIVAAVVAAATLYGSSIPTAHVTKHAFSESVALNAQIIQLANAKESITSYVRGHIERYFVKPAQQVKKGEKVALIRSIVVSKMSAEYLELQKQLHAAKQNYEATRKLYKKGLASLQELNNHEIERSKISAKLATLTSQLRTLDIDAKRLSAPTATYTLYAHSGGTVSALLKPLHSNVEAGEAMISIVKNSAYYIKSFVPLKYATKLHIGDTLVAHYGESPISADITQILPKVDTRTQRVIVLASIEQEVANLFTNAYVEANLYFGEAREYPAVQKSALSFFQNEWVVFVPNEDDEHHEERESKHDEKSEHGEHEEHEAPYTPRVVKIVTEDENYAAVEGIDVGEEYVSDKSYYVKSMILKSSLGEHGH